MHLQLLVVVANVLEVNWVVRKKTAWWNQEVKETIRTKKTEFIAWLTNKSSEQLRLRYSTARKTAATTVLSNNLKNSYGKNLDKSWIQTTDQQTKYFGKPYVVCAANKHQLLPSSRILMVCF